MNYPKHIIICLSTLFQFWSQTFSAQTANFFKTLDGPAPFNEANVHLDTLSGTEFIVGGAAGWYTPSINDTLTYDSYLLRHNANGLLTWIKRYHYSKTLLRFFCLDVLKDKNILVGGSSNKGYYSFTAPNHGILMLSSPNGNVIWTRLIPHYEVTKVKELSNEKKIIVLSDTLGRIEVLLLDKNYNYIWGQQFPTLQSGGVNSIIEGKDNSVLMLGWFNGMSSFIVLMDSLGNVVNSRTSVNFPQFLSNGFNNRDAGFYVCGSKVSNGSDLHGMLMKLDNQLNILWFREYNQSSNIGEFLDITRVSDNSILITGEPEAPFSTTKYSNPIFMDTNGVIRRSYYFMSDSFPTLPAKSFLLPDGKLLFNSIWSMTGFGVTDTISNSFCGSQNVNWYYVDSLSFYGQANIPTAAWSYSFQNITLVSYLANKLTCNYKCSAGPNVGIVYDNSIEKATSVYPNPTKDIFFVTLDYEDRKLLGGFEKFNLLNSTGQLVLSGRWRYEESSLRVDASNIPAGFYTLVLQRTNGQEVFKKIIISRD